MPEQNRLALDHCRHQISEIDKQIFELISKRQVLATEVGKLKRSFDIPDRDFEREKTCMKQAQESAQALQLPVHFAFDLQTQLMELSLTRQQKDRLQSATHHHNKSALIMGGAGRMGAWFSRFLHDQGFSITVLDPETPKDNFRHITSIEHWDKNASIIVISTPIRISIDLISKLTHIKPTGVVFDISSIKTPVYQPLLDLQKCGVSVTSLHPMFGPATELLFGKHVIRTSLGDTRADEAAASLFAQTSVQLIDMSIEEHDEAIAYLLGLSHLINILFFSVLEKSPYPLSSLQKMASTTFENQLQIAARVHQENPHLYYEIQAFNPHNKKPYGDLKLILDDLLEAILSKDEKTFVSAMEKGAQYLKGT